MIGTLLRFNQRQNEYNPKYTGLIIIIERIMPEEKEIEGRYHMINDGDLYHLRTNSSVNSAFIKRFDFI